MFQSLHKCTQTHVFYNFYCTFITHLVSIWDPTMRFYKKIYVILDLFFFEGLKMTRWRSKHVALTIYYFNVYEWNCCVIDWTVVYSIYESSLLPAVSFTARSLTLHYSLPLSALSALSALSLTLLSVSLLLLILDLPGRHRSFKVQQTMKPILLRWTSSSRRFKAS
jgi:hypothetical protein